MTDMQNTIKEVDLQIVYRRLEARKRNITRNGQMTKRQLATAYRGYHGLEPQYQALLQMSSNTMINAKSKNDHVQNRHMEDMKHLIELEKSAQGRTDKDLKTIRDDFTAQLAYQYVYKNHSFKRIYKSQQPKKPRPDSDKPEMYDLDRRNTSAKLTGPRPLGSLRQMETYNDELKLKFPPIAQHEQPDDKMSPGVNMMGGKQYAELKQENKENKQKGPEMTSFPNIEDAMGIQVKFKYTPKDDDRGSAITAPPAGIDAESDDDTSDVHQNLITYDMGQNLLLMRKFEQEKLEKRRILPQTPNTNQKQVKQGPVRTESWRRVLPETPCRPPPIFPGNPKNTVEMNKMMRKEARDVIDSWAHTSRRNDMTERAKEQHRSELAENPLPLFDRSRPTSAILREYKEYRRNQGEQSATLENAESDQPIIVKQISPQTRPESPIAQSRNDYMHVGKSGLRRERSPTPATGKLHRTDSETIPSVSRTSSYKEVPDTDKLYHENALLTAAERIELERQKRNKLTDLNLEKPPKVRRQLPKPPETPMMKNLGRSKTIDPKTNKREPIKMFDTSILAVDKDVDTINRVKLANIANEALKNLNKHTAESSIGKNHERNPYTPLANQNKSELFKESTGTPLQDGFTRMKTTSALYNKDFWPKLSKKMHFDYESYCRTPPEMKKRLETRAQNRRKIHQKNMQLAKEMKAKQKLKQGQTAEETERPPTRVSFNENVIVFQTI